MHVLVTGGAGYIGSLLTGMLLHRGYQVTVVDDLHFGGEALLPYFGHHGFHFLNGDVCEKGVVRQALTANPPWQSFTSPRLSAFPRVKRSGRKLLGSIT